MRVRAELGITAFGVQVVELPPKFGRGREPLGRQRGRVDTNARWAPSPTDGRHVIATTLEGFAGTAARVVLTAS